MLFKQTLTASILSTMIAGTAFAAPAEAPPAFIKRVADGLIGRLKADHVKLQNNPAAVKAIVRQNLDPYVDSQAFTRIVMGTYATNQYSTAAQRVIRNIVHCCRRDILRCSPAIVTLTQRDYALAQRKSDVADSAYVCRY